MNYLLESIQRVRDEHRKVLICGNGGSACNSIHFAEDLMNRGVRAMALCDIGFLTAIANDYGYEHVFSRALKLWADPGDLLLTLSCSGTSPNVVEAIKTADEMGISHIEFPTNRETGLTTPRTEDVHSEIIHDIYEALKS
jgi:D-sedoheptulose 7-phosphate isomerase